jgi:release factor glutamine methyltransferase
MDETIGTALLRARRLLTESGIESAALDARLLLQNVLGLEHADLILAHARLLSPQESQSFEVMINRRLRREPVAKILGRKEFYGRLFNVSTGVLDPRPDSEALIALVLRHAGRQSRLIDLGSGSGALIITLLLELPQARGVAVDVSAEARRMTHENAVLLGAADRLEIIDGPWLANATGQFDAIISNPPYIKTSGIDLLQADVRDFEPHLALDGGADGLTCYRAIATSTMSYLAAGGCVILEIGDGQAKAVEFFFAEAGFRKLDQEFDLEGRVRALAFNRI